MFPMLRLLGSVRYVWNGAALAVSSRIACLTDVHVQCAGEAHKAVFAYLTYHVVSVDLHESLLN